MAPKQESESGTQGLAIFAWIMLVVILLVLGVMQVISFLGFAAMDVGIYYEAALALRTGDDMFGVYGQPPLTYIYPPLLAILFMPLTFLSLEHAAAVWTVVNVVLLMLCLWLGTSELIRRFNARKDLATLPVVMLLATLVFLPRIRAELDQGQVDFLVLIGITLGLVWIARYPILAGIVLGVVANIKYQTVIFLPYFLLRGWFSAGAGFIAGAVGAALSGALVIGWSTNNDYLRRAFSGLGGMVGAPVNDASLPFIYPMDWQASISLSSTFARWSKAAGFEDGGTFVLVIAALCVCVALGWTLYAVEGQSLFKGRFGRNARIDIEQQGLIALEWTGLMIAAIAFAPQTKMRHLAVLLLVILLVVLLLVVRKKGVPRWPLLLVTILMFLGMILPPGAPEQLEQLRASWRLQGGPVWCLMILFFTMLWTGLRAISRDSIGAQTGAPTSGK